MPNDITNSPQMSNNDILTTLAYITGLQEKMIPQAPQTAQNSSQNAPQQEIPQQKQEAPKEEQKPVEDKPDLESKMTEMHTKIMEELGQIRGEVSANIKQEIDKLKSDIEKALNE